MGRSRQMGNRHQRKNKRQLKMKVTRKEKDIDEIHDDMKPTKRSNLLSQPVDHDLPGKGQHYCLTCAKYCMDEASLKQHMKSKPHKRRLKALKEEPYTHAEAERAAGMGSYIAPKEVEVVPQDIPDDMD